MAKAFAKLGPSIISPSDLKRLQEAAQVFVSENKDDRAYAVGEKVECRWKGKDGFCSIVDAVNEDDVRTVSSTTMATQRWHSRLLASIPVMRKCR